MYNILNIDQILILLLQTVIVAALLLTLFRLRTIFGLALLFTALGVFQFIQVFLSATIYFEVANNIYVSPGNIVFTGSLFAILLVYIREDALEARKVIYAILAANLVMSFMQIVVSWGINNEGVKNIYNLPIEFFTQQSRVVIVGTLVLFLDVFAVIFLYETISKKVTPFFLRILLTMLLVLTLDTFLFSLGVFIGSGMFLGSLYAGLISKYAATIIYTMLVTFYLKYIDQPTLVIDIKVDTFKDIFYQLTYKQKFKEVAKENKTLLEKLQENKIQFRIFFENVPNITYIISPDGLLTAINPAFKKLTGWGVSDWINKPFIRLVHPNDIHKTADSIKNCIDGEKIEPFELRFLCKSGEYIYGEFTIAVYKDNNNTIGVLGIVMDITERKKAETEIQAKHKLAVDTLESMSDAFVSLDKNWCYTYMNEKAGKIFNRNPKQLIGKNIWTEFPDGVGQPFQLNYEKAMAEKVYIQMEEYYEPYNLWFENRINPTEDGIAIFFQNITERKLVDNKLVESEKRYHTLFENMTSGFVLFEVVQNDKGIPIDLIILAANKGFKATTGLNLKESIGKRLTLALPGIEKDPADWIGTYTKVALTGETIQIEQFSELLNIYYSITAYQADENQCAVIFDDISGRKLAEITLRQSEIHFRQLFENNPQIMWIYDLESLQFKDVNETTVKKYGYTKEEFLSMTIKDIRPANDVSLLLKNIAKSNDKFQDSGIWNHQLKDGSLILVEINSHYLMFNNKPARLVLVNDVTDRKLAEEELKIYRNQLEEKIKERTLKLQQSEEALLNIVDDLNLKQAQLEISNQKLASLNAELETFTYSVSHDLKAPLRGIDGYSNLLQELYTDELNEEAQTFVNNIRNGTQQMNQIIEDLLAYSRLDRSLINNSSIQINPFIKQIIHIYQKELTDYHFDIENKLPETFIVADMDALSIAFRNIFENAIKFTKLVENPTITISLEDKQESWNLLIRDNGIGFDMKYYDKIFQIFQRLHRVEDYPGTGIGLAMVQKAMLRMGGNVWATSELGKGAAFYIEIPKNN